jgi:hypothetical protein
MGKCRAVFIVAAFAGCAAPFLGVRARGGEILKCPAQHLAVERTSEFEFKATGCGYSIVLICATPDGQLPCTASPVARTPVYAPAVSFYGSPGRVMTAISDPIINAAPPPPAYQRSYTPPPPPPPQTHIYMPGQYNPNTGSIQHDYAHQYTRPYTPPPPVYTPPPYHPTYTPSYHHY